MIVRWVKRGPSEYVSEWQGHSLSLQYEPSGRWHAFIGDKRVTSIGGTPCDGWHTAIMGMEAVDAVVQKMVMQRGGIVTAQQRAQSTERIHRHA